MNIKKPVVSIIIVSYNVERFLIDCVESLMRKPPSIPFEIIVVDNNSTDNSVVKLRQKFPEISIFQSDHNIGFAAANNIGASHAKGQYLYLLNPDTVVEEGAIDELYNFLSSHPSAGAAGSYLKNPDGTFQFSCYPFPTLSRELWRLLHLDSLIPFGSYPQHKWDTKSPQKCDVVQGTSLMIKRSIWDSLKGLDEIFFMYSEEVDFCYRLMKAGFENYWVPTSKVTHFGGQSTSQFAREMFIQLYRAKIQYFKKHHGNAAAMIYKFILLIASLLRLIVSPVMVWINPKVKIQQKQIHDNYKYLVTSLSRL
jgi:GT2 family glycosyltransferase